MKSDQSIIGAVQRRCGCVVSVTRVFDGRRPIILSTRGIDAGFDWQSRNAG
jgi:hypothetical protein